MTTRTRRLAFSVATIALLLSLSQSVLAQGNSSAGAEIPATVPETLTGDQIDNLVARLSDKEARELLIRQLDKAAVEEAPPEPSGAAVERFMTGMKNAEESLIGIAAVMGDVSRVPAEFWRRITAGSDASVWSFWFKILLFFAAGVIVEMLFRRSVTNVGKVTTPDAIVTFGEKFKLSLLRSIIDVISILVFALGTLIAWLVSDLPTENAQLLFTSLLTGVLVWRLVATGSRLILAPRIPWLRLVDLDDDTARSANFKLMLIATVVIFILWLLGEMMEEFAFHPAIRGAVGLLDSAVFIGIVIWVIWSLRPPRTDEAGLDATGDYFARNWHIMAIIGALLIYLLALGINLATGSSVLTPAISSLIVMGMIPILDIGLRGAVHRFMAATGDDDAAAADEDHIDSAGPEFSVDTADEPPEERKAEISDGHSAPPKKAQDLKSYESVVVNNIRIILFLIAVFTFAEIWDLKLFGLMQALFGERTTHVIVNFSITALLAYALWGIVSTAVARVAGPETGAGVHGDEGGGEGSRLGTVLPLFKKFLFITLIIMLALIFLSSLGVDIGPLIAGAGIIGIAIGFGAQTLVKDIVSGLFFLLDDAFRVGEYVTIGNTKGTVEKISVRSMRLRHHNGPLHTVPFGEIQTLTNWSRDYAIMKFEIRVPFETDVDLVRRIIKKVGQAMLEDEELGPLFLDPLKSQGVNRMDDSSFIIRCKFTSKPGNQFYMRREAYARIQAAFEERGIKFAPKRVIVETVSPDVPPQVAAAAAGAAAETEQTPQHIKDEPG